jgi:hypothetical protein
MNAAISTQSSVVAVPMLTSMVDLSLVVILMMRTLTMNLSIFIRFLYYQKAMFTFASE